MDPYQTEQILAIKLASETPQWISRKQPAMRDLDKNQTAVSPQTLVFLGRVKVSKFLDK